MSAAPTSTQMSSTQMTAHTPTQNGKRQRLDKDDDPVANEKNGNDKDSDSDSDDDKDSDGDLTHDEVLERKRKRAVQLKVLTQIRHQNAEIWKIAAQHPIPKPSTPLARAIHEFAKLLMGIPRKARGSSALSGFEETKLPDPPSEEEHQAWETQKQGREDYICQAQDKAMEKYIAKKLPGFQPNQKQRKTVEKDASEMATLKKPMQPVIFTSQILNRGRSRYPHHFGKQCEAALAMAGFPRCTFDWEASYNTPWNTTTATIILAHWVKTYDANGAREFGILTSDNTAANHEEVLRRWCTNKAPKFRDQTRNGVLLQNPAGRKKLEENLLKTQGIISKRRMKNKLYNARKAQAEKMFGKNSPEWSMLCHPEVHSDDKLKTSDSSGSRQKLSLQWRSSGLDTLIDLLDQAHWRGKIIPREKRAAKELVERGQYAPTPDADRFPPKGFQLSLISPAWYDQQEGLMLAELALQDNDVFDIQESILEFKRVFRSKASLALDATGDSSMG
ncbi:uncharacterized protein MELLADRAFT_89003 [Melampsora larici-populina 98AG31]|uniref:Uncharacterized protein n=1 Tax=Melampsora larici-populina (strain 98AG31 / pathotype 3-4-7) TaxID=747676 RepID=F4R6L9_MELLP|nr:uncharacterized protein MELLADRAFT_89003 [Melampsora larici-populina 98AG31]EGG12439.1 hypothetical protein MELLADRAFT_89003 [Melampsora larici-populina 98AG31]